MTRNDTFFKILFAFEIALLPLVVAAHIMFPSWSVGLFVGSILIVKIWMEIFKNKSDFSHIIINSIGSVLTISTLVIFFNVLNYINLALTIFVVVFTALANVFKVALYNKKMPEMIEAVDACYMMFECLTILGLALVMLYTLVSDIALFALLLTAIVSVAYKVYYLFRFYDVIGGIKNLFSKLFKRR